MVTLDWQLERTGEVTLVELSVHSDRAQRVRIESRLTPVWPPRRQGIPIRGWHGDCFEGTVDGDRPLVVGYATPARPAEPPAEVTETGRPSDEELTPRSLVRTLGDARPPRDVLPEPTGSEPASFRAVATDGARPVPDGLAAPADDGRVATGGDSPQSRQQAGGNWETANQSEAVTEWFDAVESRLATTRRLADATDADEIRDAVDDVGGIEAVRDLQVQLDADRRQLRETRHRTETLVDQLSAVELPLATLERVV